MVGDIHSNYDALMAVVGEFLAMGGWKGSTVSDYERGFWIFFK